MAGRFGVAVIGAGDMGAQHSRGWSTFKDARLVAVADPILERAKNLKRLYGFEVCVRDYREAIDRDSVDVVSVCTPAYYHPEITIYAAERGKHILCEKPIALNLRDADEMIKACRENGVHLEIGFQRRYMEGYIKIKSLLEDGALGRPNVYFRSIAGDIRRKRAMHDMRRGNGGPIIDTCCHFFDIWRVLSSSEPTQVYARGFTFAEGRPELSQIEELAPDTASINVEYESGDLGVILVSWGLPPGIRLPGSEYVLGPNGAAAILNDRLIVKLEGEEMVFPINPADAKIRQIHHFARVVLGEAEPKSTGEDGKVALMVSLAALESMRRKMPVDVSSLA